MPTVNVFLDYKLDYSGKGKFLLRLMDAIEKLDVYMSENKSADLEFGVVYWKTLLKMPRVLRIDGVHIIDSPKRDRVNGLVRDAIKASDAVIFQSQFSKRVVCTVLDIEPKASYVIYNGADWNNYNVVPIKSLYKKNVIMIAHWGEDRPAKRLKPMLKIAKKYTKVNGDVKFWVIGNVIPKIRKQYMSERIEFVGEIEDPFLRRYQKMADVMLNLAWIDWCPNAVVETLCAGTPVICSNGSGIAEIVKDSGTILDLDDVYTGKTVLPRKSPPVDEEKVFASLDYELSTKRRVKADWLDINNVAQQYKAVFEALLKNGA